VNPFRSCLFVSLALWVGSACPSQAQMIDPRIDDPNEPFCYYAFPTDVLGVMDAREGTLVTPEGYLYTGSAEIMFFTGDPPVPTSQRVKTLRKGYLPVIEYRFERDGMAYSFAMFASTLTGRPEDPLINFVRVQVRNTLKESRTTFFSVGLRYQNDANTNWGVGDNRFGRPAKADVVGAYEQSGAEFTMDWEYSFQDGAVLRDGKVLYVFPTSISHERMLTVKTGYNEKGSIAPEKLYVLPTTPVGIVKYRLPLEPGSSAVLDFAVPYDPLPSGGPAQAALQTASFDQELKKIEGAWEKILSSGTEIEIPEAKVVNTYKANLAYVLIARDKIGDQYVQKVNEFQYDSFWLRDAAHIVRMYDVTGYPAIARQCLDFFPSWQTHDGNFLSQGGQYDGWGQALWAFGEHYRITHDKAFAAKVFPLVMKAVAWLDSARASDPLRLIPVTTPGDNELISGHVTGHNFWALIGLRGAINLAKGLGKADDAASLESTYADLRSCVVDRLKALLPLSGGAIPPGLDSLGGQDWGNMMGAYPVMIFDPSDPMVTASLATTRAKYQEGIMTYGDGRWLHHYLTMKNTETELMRGEQEQVVQELYATLLHTSATHAGFEFSILPWGTRDFGMNLAPHGWFSALYRILLRDMLVREQGDDLHLLSALSPAWVYGGSTVAIRRAPTDFGEVSVRLDCRSDGADLRVQSQWTSVPRRLVLHLPWFVADAEVSAAGKRLSIKNNAIELDPTVSHVTLTWRTRDDVKKLSYETAVQDYQQEYRRRYEEFLKSGRGNSGDRP
jgi:hypothetical protein